MTSFNTCECSVPPSINHITGVHRRRAVSGISLIDEELEETMRPNKAEPAAASEGQGDEVYTIAGVVHLRSPEITTTLLELKRTSK